MEWLKRIRISVILAPGLILALGGCAGKPVNKIVMNRGNTGMNLHRSERDREKFLEYVGEALKRYGIKVHART